MAVFYNEADVKIDCTAGKRKAMINFSAFSNKGSHVKNIVKNNILKIDA